MTSTRWLRAERASLAAEQILDAAGDLAGRNHVRRHESRPFTAGAAGDDAA